MEGRERPGVILETISMFCWDVQLCWGQMRLVYLNAAARNHQWLQSFLPLYINIALPVLCSESLSGQLKMNTEPNPEMTELAMMTNVPAGRRGGRTIPHCHQDGLSHVTQRAAGCCFSCFFIQYLLIIIDSKKWDMFLSLLIHLIFTKQTHFQPLLRYYICDGVLNVNYCF